MCWFACLEIGIEEVVKRKIKVETNMGTRIHVGVDARCLNTAHIRGMGRYVSEIISRLSKTDEFSWTLFGDRQDVKFNMPIGDRIRCDIFELKGYRFQTWEQIGLPLRALGSRVDLMHCTASTAPWWQPVPTVLTLHDTLYWENSGVRVKNGFYMDKLVPTAIRKCRSIITISEQSKRDIANLWPMLQSKLYVVPHGVSDLYLAGDEMTLSSQLRDIVSDKPYLLYLGGSAPRKRFGWAIKVLEKLNRTDLELVVCGFAKEEVRDAAEKLPECVKARVKFLGFTAEEDMPGLYRNAICVLYPTLYEGFGFPVVEAQAVGTPVLFSAVGSLQELQGPGVQVLPIEDLEAWVCAVNSLAAQRTPSGVQDESARVWAHRFSWETSARQHAEIYRNCVFPT